MGGVLLVGAILSALASAITAARGNDRIARLAGSSCAVLLVAATLRLLVAISRLDYSFVYVANQSRARSGGAYRLAALWAGAEGSLLLFTALASLAFCVVLSHAKVRAAGVIVPAVVLAALGTTIGLLANPFDRAPLPPVRGAGLTPILEHPAMLYHPPILYLGLVTTLIPFALIIDRDNPFEASRIVLVRRWMLVSWSLLTVGLATGANWAYVELGWGGYWAWDPVENTVLMPWLALTAAIHASRSHQLCAQFPRSVAAAVAAPFVLVAFGTAVTRSGGLSSVHAFADEAALAWTLGAISAAVLVVAVIAVWRLPTRSTPAPTKDLVWRDRFIVLSGGLAAFTVVFVMLGVGVPLLPGSNRIVTADFYNRVGTPVLVVALAGLVALPVLVRDRSRRSLGGAGIGFGVAVATAIFFGITSGLSLVVLSLGFMVIGGHIASRRLVTVGAIVGHVGFVVLALGIAGSAEASTTTAVLAPGESASFGTTLELVYDSFEVTDGPRPRSEAVTVRTSVTDREDDGATVVLSPGLVSYPDRAVVLAETALESTARRDIQVVVRTITDDGIASFELSERPAQVLVWWGSALIAVAGPLTFKRRPRFCAG